MIRVPPLRPAIWLLVALVAAGCSKNKDRFTSRAYHRLTARDNGWFNANEKLKETVKGIEKAFVDDFDEVLPIFVYGTEAQAKGAGADLEKCIEKCSLVIERHSMDIKGEERNKWIDDAYFVIGRSYFYKRAYFDAQRTFDYAGRRFKGQNRQLESKLWLARTLIQTEQYARAQSVLDEVREIKKLPKRFPHDELAVIQADLDLKRGKVDDAIINLERAVEITKGRNERVRWTFILAQLYQVKGQDEKSIAAYKAVTRMNPPYELAFHAQVFQAMAFDQGDSKKLRKMLVRMLHDDKHVDHYDMIHYALAGIDLKENKDSSAVAHLKKSALVSTTDTRQKAKTWLRLADLYFDDRAYPDAQLYYDSTTTLLAEAHVRYEEVKTRAEVLGELVEQLNIISREDSLQALAGMDPNEREKTIQKIIRQREREEEDKAEAEAAAREALENGTAAPAKPATPVAPGDRGAWYFYNPQQLSRGLAEFKKKWGNRALEDDWRRKDRSGSALAGAEDPDEETEEALTAEKEEEGQPAWKDPAFYSKDIPGDTAAIEASNGRICEAMYRSGMIYKEKLKDVDNAIESFEVLNNRFDECRYTPESHYQLYRIYLAREKSGGFMDFGGSSSQAYANIILERWPDSEFARLVRDPSFLEAGEARRLVESAEYDQLYREYRQRNYLLVISTANQVIANEPNNHLLPKYHLLKAMAVGGTHELAAFRIALNEVKDKFPDTDEAKAAMDLLAALDKQAGTAQANDGKGPAPASTFRVDQGPHYIALIHPNEAGDVEGVKTKISDFNQRYYPDRNILVESTILNSDQQVVLLRLFDDLPAAMAYYQQFLSDIGMLAGVNDQGHAIFAISPDNYAQLFRNKDVDAYASFFTKNYLPGE
ncbi:MAG: tetratricopeptide repeat protein [Flavobacteriales bacterium]|nr:tetratricopeptide repeat protein [Flavobacteriales bacterium]